MKYKEKIYHPMRLGFASFGSGFVIPPVEAKWETRDIFIIEKYIECVVSHPEGWLVTLTSGKDHIITTKPKIKGLR